MNQINIACKLGLIERREGPRLQARPLYAETIRVDSQLRHPIDILWIAMVVIASDAAVAAILRGKIRPFVLYVAFHLGGGGGGSPEEAFGKTK